MFAVPQGFESASPPTRVADTMTASAGVLRSASDMHDTSRNRPSDAPDDHMPLLGGAAPKSQEGSATMISGCANLTNTIIGTGSLAMYAATL